MFSLDPALKCFNFTISIISYFLASALSCITSSLGVKNIGSNLVNHSCQIHSRSWPKSIKSKCLFCKREEALKWNQRFFVDYIQFVKRGEMKIFCSNVKFPIVYSYHWPGMCLKHFSFCDRFLEKDLDHRALAFCPDISDVRWIRVMVGYTSPLSFQPKVH